MAPERVPRVAADAQAVLTARWATWPASALGHPLGASGLGLLRSGLISTSRIGFRGTEARSALPGVHWNPAAGHLPVRVEVEADGRVFTKQH